MMVTEKFSVSTTCSPAPPALTSRRWNCQYLRSACAEIQNPTAECGTKAQGVKFSFVLHGWDWAEVNKQHPDVAVLTLKAWDDWVEGSGYVSALDLLVLNACRGSPFTGVLFNISFPIYKPDCIESWAKVNKQHSDAAHHEQHIEITL